MTIAIIETTEKSLSEILLASENPVIKKDIDESRRITTFQKISSAVFYGLASFLITVVNKTVLTSWHFDSVLVVCIGQLAAGVIVLYICRELGIVTFPRFNNNIPKNVMPLPLIHFGNMLTGLGGTQAMSLPMFTALRRFAILLTMLLEFKMFNIIPSTKVQISVWAMIGGAIIAVFDDLSFSIEGYSYVMLANIISATNGVYIKRTLNMNDMGKHGIMFYNSVLMIVPVVVLAGFSGDLVAAYHFNHWTNVWFIAEFTSSCIMGFILTYSIFLCTQYNSALTTAMIGCLKNVVVSYVGMFVGGDYIFTWFNCMGLNISIVGSIYYTYVIFTKKDDEKLIG